ncbi:hypothetical protein [Pseudomonas aeruginosa]|uniref:hypothetical protein n=1 Tax=Pseudomonas aeruginosa TaxID=287 RepID=UPI00355921D4
MANTLETSDLETPWVLLKDVCHCYGVNFESAKNKVAFGTFEVPTYKVCRQIVIAKEVHREHFRRKAEEGLRALKST